MIRKRVLQVQAPHLDHRQKAECKTGEHGYRQRYQKDPDINRRQREPRDVRRRDEHEHAHGYIREPDAGCRGGERQHQSFRQ